MEEYSIISNPEKKKEIIFQEAIANYGFSKEEIESAFYTHIKSENLNRVYAIVSALKPYVEQYKSTTDPNEIRRVGKLIFKTLNFKGFDKNEDYLTTKNRLVDLFRKTTKAGINPYKITYTSTLTEAEMFMDEDGYNDYKKERIGNFEAVYDKIYYIFKRAYAKVENGNFVYDAECLQNAHDSTAKLYEQCSTLLSRVNTLKVEGNCNTLYNLTAQNENGKAVKLFTREDVANIIKSNPSILTSVSGRIDAAFNYLSDKARLYLAVNKSDERSHADLLRDWIKNNSSVLLINDKEMAKREKYITASLFDYFAENDAKTCAFALFTDPTSISAINDISSNSFYAKSMYHSETAQNDMVRCNFRNSILFLIDNLGRYGAYQYMTKSRKILGAPIDKLEKALANLKEIDLQEGSNYAGRLFILGDSVVGEFDKLTVSQIIEKVMDKKSLAGINVEDLSRADIARQFFKVFAGANADEEFNKCYQVLTINANNKSAYQAISDIYKKLDALTKLYHISCGQGMIKSLKKDEKSKKEIIKSGRDILGQLQGYSAKINNAYNIGGKIISPKQYKKLAEETLKDIDRLYEENIENVRQVYKNPEALYHTFKRNTEEILQLDKTPDEAIGKFVKKFTDELLKPISSILKEKETYQTNFFEELKDQKDKTAITLPEIDDDKEFSKFLRDTKTIYKEIAKHTNPFVDDGGIDIN